MANATANRMAIALASMEQCQEPIRELHAFLEHRDISIETVIVGETEDDSDLVEKIIEKTPTDIFDNEGNFNREAFRKLEERNMDYYCHCDEARMEWSCEDGGCFNYCEKIGESLPRRRKFLKEQDLNIIALAKALHSQRPVAH